MKPIYLTVTLNPTLDVSTSVPRLIDHHKLRCAQEQEQVGGGGVNVAQVLHSLGGPCQAFFPTGGWLGNEIVRRLNDDGLACLRSEIEQPNRQCFTVYESETGHEYRFILPGPRLSETEWRMALTTVLDHLPSDYLILSGSLPPGVPEDAYAQLSRRVAQQAPGVRVVLDASGAALAEALQAGVFMVKPSIEEFAELTGVNPDDNAACIAACQTLVAAGRAQLVALSLGARGALVVSRQEALRIQPLPVKVTSTVGAGDSFVGGFVWSLAQGEDLSDAAAMATAAAAAALQTQGKLQFDRRALQKQRAHVVIESCRLSR